MTLSRRDAVELLGRHGLSPRRAFGQNFVVDPNTVRRIARLAAVGAGDRVIEIGPGLGSLTRALVETGADVTAVEIDRGLVVVLRQELEPLGVRVVEADAMTLDWDDVLEGASGWVLVANLPYNISTPLIAEILDGVPAIERMLVMVQREAAERLAAKPRTPAFGAVSVKVNYWATATIVGRVPPTVFMPQPKVDSSLVDIRRRPRPAVDVAPDRLFALVRTGFAQRRKMLRRALAGIVTTEQFHAAGIRPEARAEELDVTDWGRLATIIGAPDA